MKAIIEFPDYMYDDFCNLLDRIDDYPTSIKLLPEKHGRLIDADFLLAQEKPRGISDELWENCSEYKAIASMPTIVEGTE